MKYSSMEVLDFRLALSHLDSETLGAVCWRRESYYRCEYDAVHAH